MKRTILIALVLIPVALAQSGMQEDFEGDTIGQAPTGVGYTQEEVITIAPGTKSNSVLVDENGLGGTSQSVKHTANGQGGTPGVRVQRWNFDNTFSGVVVVELFVGCDDNSAGNADSFRWYDSDGDLAFFLEPSENPAGTCTVTPNASVPNQCQDTTLSNLDIEITLDFNNSTYGFVCVPETGTSSDSSGGINLDADNLDYWDWGQSGSASGSFAFFYDQIRINGGAPVDTGPLEPSDFDTGLVAVFESVGFVTPVSKMFATLILVGIATILAGRWTNVFDGKLRIWFIHLVVSLVGVFTVLIGFLDVWKYLLAFTISTAIHHGITDLIPTPGRMEAESGETEPDTTGDVIPDFAGVNDA